MTTTLEPQAPAAEPTTFDAVKVGPGKYTMLSNNEYHSSEGISKSQLDRALSSGRLFEYYVIQGNEQKETAAFREGKILHKVVLEFDDFGDEFAVVPELPEEALTTTDSIKSWLEAHNESLPKRPEMADLVTAIEAYNEGLDKPIAPGSNLEDNKAAYELIPVEWQTIEDEKPTAAALKKAIKAYNDSLDKPLKSKGNYATVLESYAALGPEFEKQAAEWASYPDPISTSGLKSDLIDRVKEIDDTVQFADEILAKFAADNEGKEILSQDEWQHALKIRAAVLAEPEAAMLLEAGVAEQSLYWEHAKTGELLKCRPDWSTPDHVLVDLKFVRDASPAAFARDGSQHNYHVQDAHYSEGYEAVTGHSPGFVFIAVEKDAPLGSDAYRPVMVGVYYYEEEDRQRGLALRDMAVSNIIKWRNDGYYPGYDGINKISVPTYQANREKLEIDSYDWPSLPAPEAEFNDNLFG